MAKAISIAIMCRYSARIHTVLPSGISTQLWKIQMVFMGKLTNFQWPSISIANSQSLPEGKSHQIPLNHNFPMVFLWFSFIISCVKWPCHAVPRGLNAGHGGSGRPGLSIHGCGESREIGENEDALECLNEVYIYGDA